MQAQFQYRDEDYNTLFNEVKAITEKNHELKNAPLCMSMCVLQKNNREKTCTPGLKLQSQSQVLVIALKAVLCWMV
ncbi:hypothetical protein [Bacillus cereus]|uniref:hypothetical protein n=1 Tax=Bacillus cereus group TaxID=86661 RepID=UPI002406A63E|nr:hypothetical protein [Bacillus cereus]MDA2311539.1 hypothetical protein [Bacillus cereus]MDA2315973.1 hypothetical protein [Bacillus cereus]MDA2500446.1 hypothetical protein [Bacillus cereus]MDF9611328.1 hypothetical protein [Bacillus cereus]